MVISLLYQDCASTFLVALAIAFLSHQHLCLDAQKNPMPDGSCGVFGDGIPTQNARDRGANMNPPFLAPYNSPSSPITVLVKWDINSY